MKSGAASNSSHLRVAAVQMRDRKSTRLNSSHLGISYAVFCLKKKKKTIEGVPRFDTNAMAKAGKGHMAGMLQGVTCAVTADLIDIVGDAISTEAYAGAVTKIA